MKWDHKKILDGFLHDINSLCRRIDELTGKARVEAYTMEVDLLLGKLMLLENMINNVALLSRHTFIACLERHSVIDFEVNDSRTIDVMRVKHAYHMEASCILEEYAKSLT